MTEYLAILWSLPFLKFEMTLFKISKKNKNKGGQHPSRKQGLW